MHPGGAASFLKRQLYICPPKMAIMLTNNDVTLSSGQLSIWILQDRHCLALDPPSITCGHVHYLQVKIAYLKLPKQDIGAMHYMIDVAL